MATEKEQEVGRCGFAAAPSPSGSSPVPGLAASHSVTNAQRVPLAPLLADLREPPVVGRFYMVPVVRHNWLGRMMDWPVLGPLHTDADFFNFDKVHYHVDARFLSKALAEWIEEQWEAAGRDVFGVCQASPMAQRYGHAQPEVPTGRPRLARRRCRVAEFPYRHGDKAPVQRLRNHYGDMDSGPLLGRSVPSAICKRDGRKLCPHRKVDLSQFPADADGIVTCPLHGLRVRVSEGRAHA